MPYVDFIAGDSAVLTQAVEMRHAAPYDPGLKNWRLMSFPPTLESRLAVDVSNWSNAAVAVRALGLLRENWDGYGALPISNVAVNNAAAILESISLIASFGAPEVTPTSAGTISLSWETNNTEAVLEIGNTKYSGYVQTVGQPVIYLHGDADAFGYEDSAMVVRAMQNSQSSAAANSVVFDSPRRYSLAA